MARGRRATRAAWKAVLESKQAGRGAHQRRASMCVVHVLRDDRRDAQVWTGLVDSAFWRSLRAVRLLHATKECYRTKTAENDFPPYRKIE